MKGNVIYKGRTLTDLAIILKHIGKCYRDAEARLEMIHYNNQYFADKQIQHDIEFIAFINQSLAMCSRENSMFLLNNYIHPDSGKLYYKNLSRSSLYRLNRRAIIEIADCLNL